jgi:hypothetical protein
MTPREIQLLVGVFQKFLGVAVGKRFLITNQSLDIMVQHFGEQLRWAKNQEALLQHLYDHAEFERERILLNPTVSTATVATEGVATPVVSENDAYGLTNSKPVNHHGF